MNLIRSGQILIFYVNWNFVGLAEWLKSVLVTGEAWGLNLPAQCSLGETNFVDITDATLSSYLLGTEDM